MKRFGLYAAVGSMGLGLLSSAFAQNTGKRPMTFEDLMAMKRVSDPQISPSGKWVLFSVTDVSLEKNTKVNHLWVVPLDGGGGRNYGDSSPSAQNDTSKNEGQVTGTSKGAAAERQVTFGDGETSGRFSPDGKWVSYTAKDQVYLAGWDEAAGKVGEAKALAAIAGGADGAVWSPDSKRLMFTAQVYPECSVEGGDEALRKVEPMDGKAVVGGSLKVEAWKGLEPATWAEEDACDKAKDAAAEKSPVKATVFDGLLYRHWEHWTGQKRTHIFVVDADGKNVRDVTPANEVGDAETPTFFVSAPTEYAWAPDGKEIAYVTNLEAVPAASTNNDVFTLRLDEPGARAVKVSTAAGSDDEPEYSPDGKWLAWRSQARNGFESDKFDLVVTDRRTRKSRNLTTNWDRWVDEFVWDSHSHSLYFTSGNSGDEQIYWVDEDGSRFEHETYIGVIRNSVEWGEYGDLRLSADGKRLVATRMTITHPSDIVALHLDESSLINVDDFGLDGKPKPGTFESAGYSAIPKQEQLTYLNDELLSRIEMYGSAPHGPEPMEAFEFAGASGAKVQGFIVRPPNFDPAKKYPVKFLMHGGPQTAWGDAWSYRWNWELFASSGYVVIGINRRGSTGYGQKFVDEVSGDWGGRAYEDLMKGLDYAEAHYSFIDKDRECALGASYGGFMANWVLTHTNRFKCIVTHDGVYDPVAAWGATEEMWFNEWEFRRPEDYPKGWDGFSADPKQTAEGHPAEPWRYANLPADQDPFRKWSPLRFVANAKTPTLIIHSQKDYRLDVSQGFEMFTALQRLGVPSKMLYFPDEGHWVLKPQNSQLWNEVVSDWCDRWTHSGKYAETK